MPDPSGADPNQPSQSQPPPPPLFCAEPPLQAEDRPPEPDAIVVENPVKRQNDAPDTRAESKELPSVSGQANLVNRANPNPVSENSFKIKKSSRSKAKRRTPTADDGSRTSNDPNPAGSSRLGSSLVTLTKKFIDMLHAEGGTLHAKKAAETLEVRRRRLCVVTNVLEGIGIIEKNAKGVVKWKGYEALRSGKVDGNLEHLQAEISTLSIEDSRLDNSVSKMKERLRDLTADPDNQQFLFFTEQDISSLPSAQTDTLIAIKGPVGSPLEVPDPDEEADHGQGRYRMIVSSTTGPINIYLLTKFEISDGGPTVLVELAPVSTEDQTTAKIVDMSRGKETYLQGQKHHPEIGTPSAGTGSITSSKDVDSNNWFLTTADLSIPNMWRDRIADREWKTWLSIPENLECAENIAGADSDPPESSRGTDTARILEFEEIFGGVPTALVSTEHPTSVRAVEERERKEPDVQAPNANEHNPEVGTSLNCPGGIAEIIPSSEHVTGDYWLSSDEDFSLNILWAEPEVELNQLSPIPEEDPGTAANESPTRAEIPPNTTGDITLPDIVDSPEHSNGMDTT